MNENKINIELNNENDIASFLVTEIANWIRTDKLKKALIAQGLNNDTYEDLKKSFKKVDEDFWQAFKKNLSKMGTGLKNILAKNNQ